MNVPIHTVMTIPVLLVAAATCGCNAYPTVERDFGNSVRQMVRSQQVVTGPVDTEPVRTGDGERLNGVLEAYRSDVARPQESDQPLVLDLGPAVPR